MDEHGVVMYGDFHAHSRKHNIFLYGCENRRNQDNHLREQIFPLLLHYNGGDKVLHAGLNLRTATHTHCLTRTTSYTLPHTHTALCPVHHHSSPSYCLTHTLLTAPCTITIQTTTIINHFYINIKIQVYSVIYYCYIVTINNYL